MSDADDLKKAESAAAKALQDQPEGKREEVITLFRRGLKFTEELLQENERLRFRIASLEAGAAPPPENAKGSELHQMVEDLKAKVAELETQRKELLDRFQEAESANKDYLDRYQAIEEEHNTLANVYIASYQLHSTLDFPLVVQIISEITINLVGVDKFALALFDKEKQRFFPLSDDTGVHADMPELTDGHDKILEVMQAGETFVGSPQDGADGKTPIAVIPLISDDHALGAVVLYRLLPQKKAFSPVDHELFSLLETHAATALMSALMKAKLSKGSPYALFQAEEARALLDPESRGT
jgi:hypothetical protein